MHNIIMNEAKILLKELEELKEKTEKAIVVLKRIIFRDVNNCTEFLKKDDYDPDEYLKEWMPPESKNDDYLPTGK